MLHYFSIYAGKDNKNLPWVSDAVMQGKPVGGMRCQNLCEASDRLISA